jgi:hypothetical protein
MDKDQVAFEPTSPMILENQHIWGLEILASGIVNTYVRKPVGIFFFYEIGA